MRRVGNVRDNQVRRQALPKEAVRLETINYFGHTAVSLSTGQLAGTYILVFGLFVGLRFVVVGVDSAAIIEVFRQKSSSQARTGKARQV